MKTTISLTTPAQLETESLVAVVLDESDPASPEKNKEKNKDTKPQLKLATSDSAVQSVPARVMPSHGPVK